MFRRGIQTTCRALGLSCLLLLTSSTAARGDGEGTYGQAVRLDESGQLAIQHTPNADTYNFVAVWDHSGPLLAHWQFIATDGPWHCVQVTYDKSDAGNDPDIYVNGDQVNEQEIIAPDGDPPTVGMGYCIGNETGAQFTWDGQIAQVQIHNRILNAGELESCRRIPGSVTNGLRLWLPMMHGTDIDDRSVNRFHGTATDLAAGASGPAIFTHPLGAPSGIVFLTTGILPITQHVVPRFADGVNYPGGQLRGYGPTSMIRGNSSTSQLSTSPIDQRAVVMTEDYGYPIAQWQNDTETTRKAVLQAAVRDLTIAGHDETGTGYFVGGLVNNSPNLWNKIKGKITNGTTTNPIRITSAYHSLPTGATLTIAGLDSLTGVNGVTYSDTVDRLNHVDHGWVPGHRDFDWS